MLGGISACGSLVCRDIGPPRGLGLCDDLSRHSTANCGVRLPLLRACSFCLMLLLFVTLGGGIDNCVAMRPALEVYKSDRRSAMLQKYNNRDYFVELLRVVALERGGGGTGTATSMPMRPNELIGAREVPDKPSPMLGQCEAFARLALPEGTCIPFLGNVVKEGSDGATDDGEREGYAVDLSGKGGGCMLSPSLRTASSVVNCAVGPNRTAANKARNARRQNARLMAIHDPSGFPHTFWKLTSAVGADETIWGDYGDAYWEGYTEGADCERPRLCIILRRFREPLRGFLCDLPVDLASDDDDRDEADRREDPDPQSEFRNSEHPRDVDTAGGDAPNRNDVDPNSPKDSSALRFSHPC